MDLVLIGLVSVFTAALTLFSGFGLGTILMPVFALFFPVPVAIAATVVVHLANNLFKFGLMARDAYWRVVLRFGVPAALAALAGAALLARVDAMPALFGYRLAGHLFEVMPVKALVGLLICMFAVLELSPRFQALAFPPRWLGVGGAISGFFRGLSGNQGALRSAFLLKAGLSKEAFIATGVVAAVIVDAVRLLVYGAGALGEHVARSAGIVGPVVVATVCAFAGSYLGKRVLRKVTLRAVQASVAAAMLLIGMGLAFGWV